MQETRVWSLGQEDPLEERMATHSSILAWEIPWTEKPGGLQSTARVRLKWATLSHLITNNVEHLFMWISFYMIVCHLYIISGESFSNLLTTSLFKLGHLFPYCWVLESYLYTLTTSPWLAMCSASIFPQSIASLFIFLSVFQRKEGFNCDEVQFIFFFHFLFVLLCHIQKVWLIQGLKDIFLCFVLEHLLFYIEHSGLWYILSTCLYMVQGIVKVLFVLAYQCPTVPAPFFNSLTPFAPLALYEQFISSLLHLSKIVLHPCIGQELSFEL